MCIEKILPEFFAQFRSNIAECTSATAEFFEMEIDAHPFVIFAFRLLLEVGKKVHLLFSLVKESELFVYEALITDATDGLGFLLHFLIETALYLVGWFGKDDYAESFAAGHLVCVGIAYRGIIIEIERYLTSGIRATTEEHFGAGVCHCFMGFEGLKIRYKSSGRSMREQ